MAKILLSVSPSPLKDTHNNLKENKILFFHKNNLFPNIIFVIRLVDSWDLQIYKM